MIYAAHSTTWVSFAGSQYASGTSVNGLFGRGCERIVIISGHLCFRTRKSTFAVGISDCVSKEVAGDSAIKLNFSLTDSKKKGVPYEPMGTFSGALLVEPCQSMMIASSYMFWFNLQIWRESGLKGLYFGYRLHTLRDTVRITSSPSQCETDLISLPSLVPPCTSHLTTHFALCSPSTRQYSRPASLLSSAVVRVEFSLGS